MRRVKAKREGVYNARTGKFRELKEHEFMIREGDVVSAEPEALAAIPHKAAPPFLPRGTVLVRIVGD